MQQGCSKPVRQASAWASTAPGLAQAEEDGLNRTDITGHGQSDGTHPGLGPVQPHSSAGEPAARYFAGASTAAAAADVSSAPKLHVRRSHTWTTSADFEQDFQLQHQLLQQTEVAASQDLNNTSAAITSPISAGLMHSALSPACTVSVATPALPATPQRPPGTLLPCSSALGLLTSPTQLPLLSPPHNLRTLALSALSTHSLRHQLQQLQPLGPQQLKHDAAADSKPWLTAVSPLPSCRPGRLGVILAKTHRPPPVVITELPATTAGKCVSCAGEERQPAGAAAGTRSTAAAVAALLARSESAGEQEDQQEAAPAAKAAAAAGPAAAPASPSAAAAVDQDDKFSMLLLAVQQARQQQRQQQEANRAASIRRTHTTGSVSEQGHEGLQGLSISGPGPAATQGQAAPLLALTPTVSGPLGTAAAATAENQTTHGKVTAGSHEYRELADEFKALVALVKAKQARASARRFNLLRVRDRSGFARHKANPAATAAAGGSRRAAAAAGHQKQQAGALAGTKRSSVDSDDDSAVRQSGSDSSRSKRLRAYGSGSNLAAASDQAAAAAAGGVVDMQIDADQRHAGGEVVRRSTTNLAFDALMDILGGDDTTGLAPKPSWMDTDTITQHTAAPAAPAPPLPPPATAAAAAAAAPHSETTAAAAAVRRLSSFSRNIMRIISSRPSSPMQAVTHAGPTHTGPATAAADVAAPPAADVAAPPAAAAAAATVPAVDSNVLPDLQQLQQQKQRGQDATTADPGHSHAAAAAAGGPSAFDVAGIAAELKAQLEQGKQKQLRLQQQQDQHSLQQQQQQPMLSHQQQNSFQQQEQWMGVQAQQSLTELPDKHHNVAAATACEQQPSIKLAPGTMAAAAAAVSLEATAAPAQLPDAAAAERTSQPLLSAAAGELETPFAAVITSSNHTVIPTAAAAAAAGPTASPLLQTPAAAAFTRAASGSLTSTILPPIAPLVVGSPAAAAAASVAALQQATAALPTASSHQHVQCLLPKGSDLSALGSLGIGSLRHLLSGNSSDHSKAVGAAAAGPQALLAGSQSWDQFLAGLQLSTCSSALDVGQAQGPQQQQEQQGCAPQTDMPPSLSSLPTEVAAALGAARAVLAIGGGVQSEHDLRSDQALAVAPSVRSDPANGPELAAIAQGNGLDQGAIGSDLGAAGGAVQGNRSRLAQLLNADQIMSCKPGVGSDHVAVRPVVPVNRSGPALPLSLDHGPSFDQGSMPNYAAAGTAFQGDVWDAQRHINARGAANAPDLLQPPTATAGGPAQQLNSWLLLRQQQKDTKQQRVQDVAKRMLLRKLLVCCDRLLLEMQPQLGPPSATAAGMMRPISNMVAAQPPLAATAAAAGLPPHCHASAQGLSPPVSTSPPAAAAADQELPTQMVPAIPQQQQQQHPGQPTPPPQQYSNSSGTSGWPVPTQTTTAAAAATAPSSSSTASPAADAAAAAEITAADTAAAAVLLSAGGRPRTAAAASTPTAVQAVPPSAAAAAVGCPLRTALPAAAVFAARQALSDVMLKCAQLVDDLAIMPPKLAQIRLQQQQRLLSSPASHARLSMQQQGQLPAIGTPLQDPGQQQHQQGYSSPSAAAAAAAAAGGAYYAAGTPRGLVLKSVTHGVPTAPKLPGVLSPNPQRPPLPPTAPATINRTALTNTSATSLAAPGAAGSTQQQQQQLYTQSSNAVHDLAAVVSHLRQQQQQQQPGTASGNPQATAAAAGATAFSGDVARPTAGLAAGSQLQQTTDVWSRIASSINQTMELGQQQQQQQQHMQRQQSDANLGPEIAVPRRVVESGAVGQMRFPSTHVVETAAAAAGGGGGGLRETLSLTRAATWPVTAAAAAAEVAGSAAAKQPVPIIGDFEQLLQQLVAQDIATEPNAAPAQSLNAFGTFTGPVASAAPVADTAVGLPAGSVQELALQQPRQQQQHLCSVGFVDMLQTPLAGLIDLQQMQLPVQQPQAGLAPPHPPGLTPRGLALNHMTQLGLAAGPPPAAAAAGPGVAGSAGTAPYQLLQQQIPRPKQRLRRKSSKGQKGLSGGGDSDEPTAAAAAADNEQQLVAALQQHMDVVRGGVYQAELQRQERLQRLIDQHNKQLRQQP